MTLRKEVTYVIDENGCHICISHLSCKEDYPKFFRNGKVWKIYRFLYIEKYGELPKGIVVRHKCDNKMCINVDHLEAGTHQDNMNDKVNRGRSLRGSQNPASVLTEEDVRMIKMDIASSHRQLARKYGVSQQTISKIRNGILWKHIVV